MLVTSTPPKPAAARLSSSAVRFWLSTALPIHHQRVHGLASGVVWGHARSGACPSATRARRSNGRTATFTWTTLLIASPTGPHPLIPSPCGRGETRHALLFPLSRRERAPGGEDPHGAGGVVGCERWPSIQNGALANHSTIPTSISAAWVPQAILPANTRKEGITVRPRPANEISLSRVRTSATPRPAPVGGGPAVGWHSGPHREQWR